MKIFSYVFHVVLALFLLGISSLAWLSGTHSLNIGVLPWKEATLTFVLFGGSLLGIALVVLAFFGILRLLFFVWSLAVAVLLLRGYIFSQFAFAGKSEFHTALCLTLAAMLAVVGAWCAFRQRPQPVQS